MPLKIYSGKDRLNEANLCKMLDGMQKSHHQFTPAWSNVTYWYAPEILEVLSRYWGFINNTDGGVYATIIKSALLKANRRFSYTEDRTPKLARSKRKLKAIEELLKENWQEQLDEMLYSLSLKTLKNLNDFVMHTQQHQNEVAPEKYTGREVLIHLYATVPRECDALITSPPYLQAQE